MNCPKGFRFYNQEARTMGIVETAQPTIELCWDCWKANGGTCDFDSPHDGFGISDHVCPSRKSTTMIGKVKCPQCGTTVEWIAATEEHIDSLYAEAWGISDPSV